MINAAEVVENLRPIGLIPSTESQARPLTQLEPEEQSIVWQRAIDTAPNGKVTAAHVQATVDAYQKKAPLTRVQYREDGIGDKQAFDDLQWDQDDVPSREVEEYEKRTSDTMQWYSIENGNGVVEDGRLYPGEELKVLTEEEWSEVEEKRLPHVAHNSGNNEWYTPVEYITAAHAVMGRIDLDPASSPEANAVVRARDFYTATNNGLQYRWLGKVWMNPPYASGLVNQFVRKMAEHVSSGDVTEAIVLVNNATETEWFRQLISVSSCVCFPRSRVKFWRPDGDTGAPLQGQAIIYIGTVQDMFLREFSKFGWCSVVTNI